jgi:hypothetical protein
MADMAPMAGDLLDVAFIPRASFYGGRHLELVIEDFRPAAARGNNTLTE